MKKLIATTILAVITVTTFAVEKGLDVRDVKAKLNLAIYNGDAAAAANWAATLNSLKQAKLADEQTKLVATQNNVVTVYGNVIKSAPAVLQMMRYYNERQTHPDNEMSDVIDMLGIAIKLTSRPITTSDLKPIVDSIIQREKKLEAEHEAWLKKRK